jgi:D-alanyl-D-alanine carboxypeptidase/D-alanyl-D-alanine-endopeptidase (penicillin-binding protein 4)
MRKVIFLVLIGLATTGYALDSYWHQLLSLYQFDKSKQAYCYRNKLGRIVGENIDLQVRPASVTKLYVSLWALETLKKDHRFKTKFYIYEDHLHIEGGHDPYFTTENLYYLISTLNDMGYEEFDSISFDENFYFNWSDDSQEITDLLNGYFNTADWNQAHLIEFENLVFQNQNLGINLPLRDEIQFQVSSLSLASRPNETPILTGTFQSSPLPSHLKQMNIYSTNFIAQKVFDYLGGVDKFAAYIKEKFNAGEETISFQNGAGFEPNMTTCRLTINVIERLKFQIQKQGLQLSDLISVPGEDLGTLQHRYQNHLAKTLVAKTGTLRHTSALSGFLSTDLGEKPFGIFNHSYNIDNARKLQDQYVQHLFVSLGDPQSYMYYRSDYIPLIGSDLEYVNQ